MDRPSFFGVERAGSSLGIDREGAALLGILAVAAFVRLHGIDEMDVWIDEANIILTAKQPVSTILGKLRLDSSPPLFYFVLHLWIRVFGDGEVALRLLSALTGVALVGATCWAGRELISREVGLWAALFVAASPLQAFYSQQVRMYVLLSLFALLSVALLVRHLREGKRRDFALWLVVTILALYTHNFALYLLPVHGVVIALSGRLVRGLGSWVLAAAILVVAYAPWVPFFVDQLRNADHYAWFLHHWESLGPWGVVRSTFRSYSPGAEYAMFGDMELIEKWRGWPTLGVVGLAGLGAWMSLRRRERGSVETAWPLAFLLVPIASAVVASSLLTPHYVPGRVDQMMLPAFALLVGMGLAHLRPPPVRFLVAGAILVVALWSKWNLYPDYQLPDYQLRGFQGTDRDLALKIAEYWGPEDVILCTSLSRASLEYYLGRTGIEARLLSFPRQTAEHLGSQNDQRLLSDRPALRREANEVMAQARSMAGAEGRLVMVWVGSEINELLSPDLLGSRFGFRKVAHLGLFKQLATAAQVVVVAYRPIPDR